MGKMKLFWLTPGQWSTIWRENSFDLSLNGVIMGTEKVVVESDVLTLEKFIRLKAIFNEADKALEGKEHCVYVNGKVEKFKVPKRQNLDVMRKRLAMYGMTLVNA